MTILFTSIFSGIELIFDRQFGFLKEMLVAPVPRLLLMIGRTLGGRDSRHHARPHRRRHQHADRLPARPQFAAPSPSSSWRSIAILFTALGTAIASVLSDMQGFQLIMNFLVMPIFFLSGALFPLNNVPGPLSIIASHDPLSYGVDGLRSALVGTSHFGIPLDLAVLSIICAICMILGAYLFSRIQL